jgi:hypothetical protein
MHVSDLRDPWRRYLVLIGIAREFGLPAQVVDLDEFNDLI